MRMFALLFNIFQTYITMIPHLLELNTYEMNIKTKLLEDYVNFVDTTRKQIYNLCICRIIFVSIVIILTNIRVVILS